MRKRAFNIFVKQDHKKLIEKMIFTLWIMVQCVIVLTVIGADVFFYTDNVQRCYLFGLCILEFIFSVLIILDRKHKASGSCLQLLEIICFSILCIGQLEIALGILYNFKDIAAGVWNVLLMLFAVLFLSLLFRRIKRAMITLNIIVLLLGIANHYFYLIRKQPLLLSDILLSETAVNVIGNYTYKIDAILFFFLLIQFGILLSCLLKSDEKYGENLQGAFLVGCFAILLGKAGYTPPIYNWAILDTVKNSGYINTAVAKAFQDRKYDAPENYSPQIAEKILKQYEREEEVGELVNVIVIMNETLSDLPYIYDFETDTDGMPFIHSLEENAVKGNCLVSAYGGDTANTEYEFLTGNTMAFFGERIIPYVQFVKKAHQSLAGYLKDLGYQTIAFHPASPQNYNRNTVYPFMGFDDFVSIESELKNHNDIRWYMSDESDYRNIIDMYENRETGKPLFVFNVTIQNHGGYSMDESAVEVTVKPKDSVLQRPELLEYLSLIKASDEAFEKLTSYFAEQDEKTVILIFGDHQPSLGDEMLNILNKNVENDKQFAKGNRYITPFVIWANYDISEEKDMLISPGYLRGLLLETAGIPLSNYDCFLADCRERYPAINFYGGYDNAGNEVEWEDMIQDEQIKQWEILQYANVFGGKETIKLFE